MTFYSAVFPFTAFSTVFLQEKFGLSAVQGGFFTSLVITGSMIFTPVFGFIVDKFGKRASMMIVGSLMIVPVHLLLGLTRIHPTFSMVVLGISLSLVPAAMWPSMVKLVKEKEIGTAYGLMYSIQNLGLWGIPILAGIILDKTNPANTETLDYTTTMIMFTALGLIGLVFALLLKRENKKNNYGVELPLNKRKN